MLISDMRESSWGQEHVPAEGEERDLLMLFRYGPGPIVYALYRVKVPYLSAFHEFSCYLKKKNTPREVSFHPILELPISLYPMGMCCAELHNKLYFIGGHYDSLENDKAKLPAYDIYAFDPTDTNIDDGKITSGYSNASSLRSRPCGKLIRAKLFPYAFVAMEKIFVIDNQGEAYNRPDDESYFEVFDPNDEKNCVELASPPVGFVIIGHAVVGEKIFLNGYGRGRIGHVICFDAETNQWMQDFIQDFSYGHMFMGEGQLVGDTMYAVAGRYFSTPAAYKLSAERLQYNIDQCAAMNSECALDERVTDLFDECALLSPSGSLDEVHQLVSYNWLGAMIVHVGDGVFCYMRSGKFPHESCHEYTGVVLAFFKPHVNHTTSFFGGQFLHSAELKFQVSRPGGDVSLVRCFSIPKGRKHADRGQKKLQVVGKEIIGSRERSIQLLEKQLLEIGFMVAENEWKNLSAGWDEYLMNLRKEGWKAMEKLRGGDPSGRKDALKFKKEVENALRYATYLRQIWEIKLPESAEGVFSERLVALNLQRLVALSL